MRKAFTLSLLLTFAIIVTAQETVTLRFTSTTPSGSYYPFDVVNVTNVTRGWTESLAYPDTTMVLTSYDGLKENNIDNMVLSDPYPNPMSGKSDVLFRMDQTGYINIKLMDIKGNMIVGFNDILEDGFYKIRLNIDKPQIVFLVVRTDNNQYVKKVLNMNCGSDNSILVNKISEERNARYNNTDKEFVIGDVMSYVAVSFYNGDMLESQRITKAQYDDELVSLLFNVNTNPTIPTVTTSIVTNVTHNTAVAGGNVIDNGGAAVTERGVCWSTNPNPTASGNHIAASTSGTGNFVCNVTGLIPETTYYLRAYAINSVGPSYGNEESFTTIIDLPIINMDSIAEVTISSSKLYATVIDDGGTYVDQRGFCWSTSPNPTINDSHTSNWGGTSPFSFSHNLTGLTNNTVYYVRAHATNTAGTAYSEQMTFITVSVILPSVTTNDVSSITYTTAVCGGNITNDGGGSVVARGVCWSTSPNPTITNQHTTDGSGLGDFTSNITGLTENTTYYIRAYATNEAGTAYGEQKTFVTEEILLPTVLTEQVSSISFNSAVCGGNITDDGGSGVTARGVCWSTNPNPTIANQHTTDESGMGAFTSNITGLAENTTYYVRAYATNVKGTAYGSLVSFATCTPNTWTNGILPGLFSVSESQQVYFSQGNLQYKASTHTWKFADKQIDYVGADNSNISSTYTGWIDLFGWGTGYYPTNSSGNGGDYLTFNDWGNNAISNGGNTQNVWRTLNASEWNYIINTRNTISGLRYIKAIVDGINGLVLLPDDWNSSLYSFNNANTPNAWFSDNVISMADWINLFEINGAVFLPSAGYRNMIVYYANGDNGNHYGGYWSSTRRNSSTSWSMHFDSAGLAANGYFNPSRGNSVRLVKNAE